MISDLLKYDLKNMLLHRKIWDQIQKSFYSLKFETIPRFVRKMRFLYKKIFRSMPFTPKQLTPKIFVNKLSKIIHGIFFKILSFIYIHTKDLYKRLS